VNGEINEDFLAKWINVRCMGYYGPQFTPLVWAARENHLEVVRHLCLNEAVNQEEALIGAALFGHIEIVRFLFTLGTNIKNPRAMVDAAFYGHMEIVKFLHQHGASLSNLGDEPILGASLRRKWNIVERDHI
jgi:ankyrin repeat protein